MYNVEDAYQKLHTNRFQLNEFEIKCIIHISVIEFQWKDGVIYAEFDAKYEVKKREIEAMPVVVYNAYLLKFFCAIYDETRWNSLFIMFYLHFDFVFSSFAFFFHESFLHLGIWIIVSCFIYIPKWTQKYLYFIVIQRMLLISFWMRWFRFTSVHLNLNIQKISLSMCQKQKNNVNIRRSKEKKLIGSMSSTTQWRDLNDINLTSRNNKYFRFLIRNNSIFEISCLFEAGFSFILFWFRFSIATLSTRHSNS